MTHPIVCFIMACAVVLASSDVSAQESKHFQKDRFAIGYWVGPRTSDNLRERYREIAEANFTLVMGRLGETSGGAFVYINLETSVGNQVTADYADKLFPGSPIWVRRCLALSAAALWGISVRKT
jgi:hypothetical protein